MGVVGRRWACVCFLFMGLEGERADPIAGPMRVVQETFPSDEASRLRISTHSGYLTRKPRWVISADCSQPMRDQVCRMPLEASFRWFAEGEWQCGVVCGTVQE